MRFIPSPEHPAHYTSDDGRYTAEKRPSGYYSADLTTRLNARRTTPADTTVKLARHFVIRDADGQVIGTARTLADAERYLPDNTTHHLVPRAAGRGAQEMRCRYCGRTEREIGPEATRRTCPDAPR